LLLIRFLAQQIVQEKLQRSPYLGMNRKVN
jgi:hypothetical protein